VVAGFQVSINGRFWVSTEGSISMPRAPARFNRLEHTARPAGRVTRLEFSNQGASELFCSNLRGQRAGRNTSLATVTTLVRGTPIAITGRAASKTA
jgi:hypothetical protein